MLVSGLVTGGVGPWLPGQMFTAGWVGMSAMFLRPFMQPLMAKYQLQKGTGINREIIMLAIFGLAWGFLYGSIMNLWQWPFIAGPQVQSWIAGSGFMVTLQHYLAFYLVTSLVWDAIAAIGNFLLILAFGAATLRALRRFQQRFVFIYVPDKQNASGQNYKEMTG